MRRPCAGSEVWCAEDPAAASDRVVVVPTAGGVRGSADIGVPVRVQFGSALVLTKAEVLDLCDLLDRMGGPDGPADWAPLQAAARSWVDALESRLAADAPRLAANGPNRGRPAPSPPADPSQAGCTATVLHIPGNDGHTTDGTGVQSRTGSAATSAATVPGFTIGPGGPPRRMVGGPDG